jgi:hypothetical protein
VLNETHVREDGIFVKKSSKVRDDEGGQAQPFLAGDSVISLCWMSSFKKSRDLKDS